MTGIVAHKNWKNFLIKEQAVSAPIDYNNKDELARYTVFIDMSAAFFAENGVTPDHIRALEVVAKSENIDVTKIVGWPKKLDANDPYQRAFGIGNILNDAGKAGGDIWDGIKGLGSDLRGSLKSVYDRFSSVTFPGMTPAEKAQYLKFKSEIFKAFYAEKEIPAGVMVALIMDVSNFDPEFQSDKLKPPQGIKEVDGKTYAYYGLMGVNALDLKLSSVRYNVTISSRRVFEPDVNLSIGARRLRKFIEKHNNNYRNALTDYFGGDAARADRILKLRVRILTDPQTGKMQDDSPSLLSNLSAGGVGRAGFNGIKNLLVDLALFLGVPKEMITAFFSKFKLATTHEMEQKGIGLGPGGTTPTPTPPTPAPVPDPVPSTDINFVPFKVTKAHADNFIKTGTNNWTDPGYFYGKDGTSGADRKFILTMQWRFSSTVSASALSFKLPDVVKELFGIDDSDTKFKDFELVRLESGDCGGCLGGWWWPISIRDFEASNVDNNNITTNGAVPGQECLASFWDSGMIQMNKGDKMMDDKDFKRFKTVFEAHKTQDNPREAFLKDCTNTKGTDKRVCRRAPRKYKMARGKCNRIKFTLATTGNIRSATLGGIDSIPLVSSQDVIKDAMKELLNDPSMQFWTAGRLNRIIGLMRTFGTKQSYELIAKNNITDVGAFQLGLAVVLVELVGTHGPAGNKAPQINTTIPGIPGVTPPAPPTPAPTPPPAPPAPPAPASNILQSAKDDSGRPIDANKDLKGIPLTVNDGSGTIDVKFFNDGDKGKVQIGRKEFKIKKGAFHVEIVGIRMNSGKNSITMKGRGGAFGVKQTKDATMQADEVKRLLGSLRATRVDGEVNGPDGLTFIRIK